MATELVLDPPANRGSGPGPRLPTLILPAPYKPAQFLTLAALARRLHKIRGERGLQLVPGFASYFGSDTFPIFKLYVLAEDSAGGGDYVGAIAVQGRPREAVEAAIAAENPHLPAEQAA